MPVVEQIGTLTTFVPGTLAKSAEVNSNFTEIKNKFNALVPAADTIIADFINTAGAGTITFDSPISVTGAITSSGQIKATAGGIDVTGAAVFSTTGSFGGNLSVTGDLSITGSFSAGSLDLSTGVTLQGGAPTPEDFDSRFSYGSQTTPAAQFYAEHDNNNAAQAKALAAFLYYNVFPAETGFALDVLAHTGVSTGGSSVGYAARFRTTIDGANPNSPTPHAILVQAEDGDGIRVEQVTSLGAGIRVLGTNAYAFGVRIEDAASGVPLFVGATTAGARDIDTTVGAYLDSATGVWTDASTRKIKKDVKDYTTASAMRTIRELRLRRFYRGRRDVRQCGFLADEVPDEMATDDREGLAPGVLASYALAGVMDLDSRVRALEAA